jgi:hypothetical protein
VVLLQHHVTSSLRFFVSASNLVNLPLRTLFWFIIEQQDSSTSFVDGLIEHEAFWIGETLEFDPSTRVSSSSSTSVPRSVLQDLVWQGIRLIHYLVQQRPNWI